MLQVTNGINTLTVSRGAYMSLYRNRGFHVVGDEEAEEVPGMVDTHADALPCDLGTPSHQPEPYTGEEEPETEDEGAEEGEEDVDLSEIPLGEMDFETLCRYADQLNVERNGIRSRKELRSAIREHLKNN